MSTDGLRLFPNTSLRGLFVGAPFSHFPEQAFALQFSFQHLECLLYIIVSYQNLHLVLLAVANDKREAVTRVARRSAFEAHGG